MSESKNENIKSSKIVSNLERADINVALVNDAINKPNTDVEKNKVYNDFCSKYLNENLENKKIDELTKIYEIGTGLINAYYIENTEKIEIDTVKQEIITQIQSIIMRVMYVITTKRFEENNKQNLEMNKSLNKATQSNKKMKMDFIKQNKEIKNIKNEVKTIVTTIISIILAISIIPTAIAGIEKIDANYILPFVSSIMLFGMIMIVFVYSIYLDKIKIGTWILLAVMILLTAVFWLNSIENIVNIQKNNINQTVQEVHQDEYTSKIVLEENKKILKRRISLSNSSF